MSDRKVIVEVTVPAPVDAVWRALRDPGEIRRWFGWDYEGLDDEIESIFVAGASVSEADRTIDVGDDRFALESRGDRTVVRVTRAAPAGADWQDIYDEVSEGWRTFVEQLRFYLARHDGKERRTLHFKAQATDRTPPPMTALGLDAVASVPAGSPYELATPFGDTLAGEVWFRSAHQVGVTVDSYGLLVVTDQPTDDDAPHGGGRVILTTYGLDDGSFEELRRRWEGWFRDAYG